MKHRNGTQGVRQVNTRPLQILLAVQLRLVHTRDSVLTLHLQYKDANTGKTLRNTKMESDMGEKLTRYVPSFQDDASGTLIELSASIRMYCHKRTGL